MSYRQASVELVLGSSLGGEVFGGGDDKANNSLERVSHAKEKPSRLYAIISV